MGVRRYQDLVAWQLANSLKKQIYALVEGSAAKRDFRFRDQITDAAASGPSNLSEAFGAYGHPEAARYVRIACSSLMETHNHLGDGVDRHHWTKEQAEPLQDLAEDAKEGGWSLAGLLDDHRRAIALAAPVEEARQIEQSAQALSTRHQAPSTKHRAPSTEH